MALKEYGLEATHLEAVGLRHAKDASIWDFALQKELILLTKDEDFVERFRRVADGPTIVWLRIGNASTKALLGWFLPILPTLVRRVEAGDRLIEIRE